jgi:hypothetical protein
MLHTVLWGIVLPYRRGNNSHPACCGCCDYCSQYHHVYLAFIVSVIDQGKGITDLENVHCTKDQPDPELWNDVSNSHVM